MAQPDDLSRWPVPYLETIRVQNGGIVDRCCECKQFTLCTWYTETRNVARGPEHGGWKDMHTYVMCHDCIDRYLDDARQRDDRTLVRDGRPKASNSAP